MSTLFISFPCRIWLATLLYILLCVHASGVQGETAEIHVRAQYIGVDSNHLLIESGNAFTLSSGLTLPPLFIGEAIRLRLNRITHQVTEVEAQPKAFLADEVTAAALAGITTGVAPYPQATIQARPSKNITVTIRVDVPNNTPLGDVVYLSTERSGFTPAEIRMNRLGVNHWEIQLIGPENLTLHYAFTRGSYATIERNANGQIVTAHECVFTPNATTHDSVARWADRP